MKIRIKGDSLRLRVSRSEVERLPRGQHVAETEAFGSTAQKVLAVLRRSFSSSCRPRGQVWQAKRVERRHVV